MVTLFDAQALRRSTTVPPSRKRNQKLLFIALFLAAFYLGGVTFLFARDYFFPVEEFSLGRQAEATDSPGAAVAEGKKPSGGGHGSKKPNKPLPGGQEKKEERVLIKDALLPTSVVPVRYDLKLKAYLPGYRAQISKTKNLTFEATIDIDLTAHESVDKIVLNSVELNIHKEESYVITETGERIKVTNVEKKEKLETVVFTFENKLPLGNYKFTISYDGKIRDSLNGLYQTHYTTGDGTPKIAAATQMEPLYARRMVPCFDEPNLKASWAVTVTHPRGTTAIANGIELDEPKEDGDFLTTRFKETPAMSSYLLAILISEFGRIEGYTKAGVRFRIWARPEAMETANFALEAGILCIDGFAKYFNISFPLEKQDMVALPDFEMGAMENWGLITYRETALLYDSKNYFYNSKQRVASVIAHELAHQWFGNLVTMKWWDDIWLNEGLATYVENLGMEMIFPGILSRDVIDAADTKAPTLVKDAKASSRPIVFSVDYQEEIDDIFDGITYQKGGYFLSMLNRIMGKAFDQGVINYLKKYAYKNTVHLDLFREWDKVVPEDLLGANGLRLNVTEFAMKWTGQMGYPLLSLERLNKTHSRITQKRFKEDPAAKEREKFAVSPYGFKWDVPVFIKQGEKAEYMKWMPSGGEIVIESEQGEPVVLNTDSVAIARMHYEGDGWDNIGIQLAEDNTVYSEITKFRIISDVFTMASVGKTTYKKAFETASYISAEKTTLPWEAYLSELSKLKDYYGTLPERKIVEAYQKSVMRPIFKETDDIMDIITAFKDDKSYEEKKLSLQLYLSYCSVDKAACRERMDEAYDQDFKAHCENKQMASDCGVVPTAIRSRVYCQAVENGGEETFQLFLKKYKIEQLQLERNRLMMALACTRDPVTIKWLLATLLDRNSGQIRSQDTGSITYAIAKNPVGGEIVFNYLLSNWDKILKSFSSSQSIVNKIIADFISPIRTRHELKQLEEFMEREKSTEKYYQFTKSLMSVKQKVDWLEKQGADVAKLLHSIRRD